MYSQENLRNLLEIYQKTYEISAALADLSEQTGAIMEELEETTGELIDWDSGSIPDEWGCETLDAAVNSLCNHLFGSDFYYEGGMAENLEFMQALKAESAAMAEENPVFVDPHKVICFMANELEKK